MMISDEERRKVARRLRELPTDMYEVEELWEMKGLDTCCKDQTDYYLIHFALFGCFPADHMHPCDYEELHNRLADLIEPPTQCPLYHSDRHYCSVYEDVHAIDRDALLALADEMGRKASNWDVTQRDVPFVHAGHLLGYADRIRDALGVADA